MKYYRKQPVEAIQWNGDDQMEVSDFILKVTRTFATKDDGYGNLNVCYMDSKKRKHQAVIPKFGWVVIEGKTLQFYKDETFRKTFKAAKDESAERTEYERTLGKLAQQEHEDDYKSWLEAMFGKKSSKDVMDAIKETAEMHKDPFFVPANENVCKDNNKEWIDAWKSKAGIVCDDVLRIKVENGKHVESDTFEKVLDEMKELHAKKNKDYKGSFHDLFKEYGMPYALGHLEEKLNRVKAITANGGSAVKNEHVEDSLMDMACYAVMLYVELKNKDNGED